MALVAIGQGAVRQSLAAPVQGIHAIAAAQQLADDLGGVFFDELAPARQQDDAALGLPWGSSRDVPAGVAQPDTGGLKETVTRGRHIGSSQVGGNGGRRGCRVVVNHRRRCGEGRARKPAEIWAFWPSSLADSLPFRCAFAIDRAVAASSAKGRRRGNRAQGSLQEVSPLRGYRLV